jgi:acyl carrier protein
MLTFDEFCSQLRLEFDIDEEHELSRSTSFQDDLQFDSLELMRLGVFVELVSDAFFVADELDIDGLTIGACFDIVGELARRAASEVA